MGRERDAEVKTRSTGSPLPKWLLVFSSLVWVFPSCSSRAKSQAVVPKSQGNDGPVHRSHAARLCTIGSGAAPEAPLISLEDVVKRSPSGQIVRVTGYLFPDEWDPVVADAPQREAERHAVTVSNTSTHFRWNEPQCTGTQVDIIGKVVRVPEGTLRAPPISIDIVWMAETAR